MQSVKRIGILMINFLELPQTLRIPFLEKTFLRLASLLELVWRTLSGACYEPEANGETVLLSMRHTKAT